MEQHSWRSVASSELRKNDFPFKVGARARGTGMDSATHDDGGNDVAIANAGSVRC